MNFRCKKLLVTGGAGFIGSNFISRLLEKHDDLFVYNLDLLTYAGSLTNTNSFSSNNRYKFIHGNICDGKLLDRIFKKYKIDGVINFAAESHVDTSIENPEIFIETNVMGVYKLLNICYKSWMNQNFNYKPEFEHSRFHQVSTDEVYGSIVEGSFTEKSLYKPNSPYSASKASADMIVRSFNKTFGLNTTISLCSNNFGNNQNKEKFIPKIIDCLINNNPIPLYGDGKNIRDWIYVEDHCEAVDLIFNKGVSGHNYNISSNNELENIELINIVYEILTSHLKNKKIEKKIKFIDDRFGHDRRYSLCSKKLQTELNWKTKYDFKKSLDKYIHSF
tara:strand:- start:26 stop:1024 length:999 start_codon:yes stop_codon:yes gene_type:complete